METVKTERTTKETSVCAEISFPGTGNVSVSTTVPFFDHMLTALFFHGGFDAKIKAKGDTEIDDHHLVEDTGIVIGQCLAQLDKQSRPTMRFGSRFLRPPVFDLERPLSSDLLRTF